MIQIFQTIGKPDAYQEKEFEIEDKSYISCLCTDALREYLKGKGEDVVLTIFIPESLLLDESLKRENLDEFCDKIREKGIEDFKAVVIPSVGRYRLGDREVDFSGNVEVISTSILLHFLELKPDKVYIDVSTGFNIYPVTLLEAV